MTVLQLDALPERITPLAEMRHRVAREVNSLWGRLQEMPAPESLDPGWGPCWVWTGALNSSGYGVLRWRGRLVLAHRLAVKLCLGGRLFPAPRLRKGKLILHRCHVRRCCNPLHLRFGSHSDNQSDRFARARRTAPTPIEAL